MSSVVSDTIPLRPARFVAGGLIHSLDDPDHDRWVVTRNGFSHTFCREISHLGRYPCDGYLVIQHSRDLPLRAELYRHKHKVSLFHAYGEELALLTEKLLLREYCIQLFNSLVKSLPKQQWNYGIHFDGTTVTDRYVMLKHEKRCRCSPVASRSNPKTTSSYPFLRLPNNACIVVTEENSSPPVIECDFDYPRPIKCKFTSSRVRSGVNHLTSHIIELATNCNQEPETTWSPPEPPEWE
jgi:hypothetical protein